MSSGTESELYSPSFSSSPGSSSMPRCSTLITSRADFGLLRSSSPDLTFTRSTHLSPSTTASTTRKRLSDLGSDSKIQFQLHHTFGDSDFSPVGTFSARLKTWNHGGQKFKLKIDYKSIRDEHNTNCT
ncbi:hypothetical protein ACFX2F_016887 [Malus domestica]